MAADRIVFEGNPWPEGHAIEVFTWTAREVDGEVWFDLHLETADYYAERDIEDDGEDADSSWESPGVWGNYHACTLSSTKWHEGGFKVCAKADYSPAFLDGREFIVDPDPESFEDWDDHAFHIYLLGHDAVSRHRIRFERIGDSNDFTITWEGRIALAYVGQHEYRYAFSAVIGDVPLPDVVEAGA